MAEAMGGAEGEKRWRRRDVELEQIWARGRGGLLYKVVGLIDEPVVVIVPYDERDGEELEHFVIGSRQFAEFVRHDETDVYGHRTETVLAPPPGAVNYTGPDESVECAYPCCVNRLRKADGDDLQFCSSEHRDGAARALTHWPPTPWL